MKILFGELAGPLLIEGRKLCQRIQEAGYDSYIKTLNRLSETPRNLEVGQGRRQEGNKKHFRGWQEEQALWGIALIFLGSVFLLAPPSSSPIFSHYCPGFSHLGCWFA